MGVLDDYRKQFPQYNSISDDDLEDALYKKYYSNMPRAEFYAKIGVKDTAKDIQKADGNYALETLGNVPGSATKAATDLYNTVRHPIQTVENLGSLAKGISQKLGLSSGKDSVQYADAAWNYLKDRYGSVDAIKKSFHDDPVGVLLDASTVLSGGETLAARLPVVGERAAQVARAVNPVNVATKAIGFGASKATGLYTGVGGKTVTEAFAAGKEGGEASKALTGQMREQSPTTEIVSDVKGAVAKLRQQRGAAYVADMANLKESKKVLPFEKIDDAMDKVFRIKRFKGKDTQRSAAGIRNQINEVVSEWRNSDPAEFHTAEGLDALKQTVGDLRDGAEFGSPSRAVADEVYHAIRKTIVDEFPKYGETMKGYETATQEIKEIETTLSAKPNANIDTSLRKITSALRDNVNTNFGRRRELVEFLARNGAPHLLAKIAGQSLRSSVPRGIVGQLGSVGAGLDILHNLASSNPMMAIKLSVAILLGSPRLVGEAAHALGQLSRLPVRNVSLGLRAVSPPGPSPQE